MNLQKGAVDMPQPASCLLALLRGALNGQAVPALPQETDEAAMPREKAEAIRTLTEDLQLA